MECALRIFITHKNPPSSAGPEPAAAILSAITWLYLGVTKPYTAYRQDVVSLGSVTHILRNIDAEYKRNKMEKITSQLSGIFPDR
jgi:hypothetical protein